VPGFTIEAVFSEEHCRQAATACYRIPAVDIRNGALSGRKIDHKYSEMVSDHDAASPVSSSSFSAAAASPEISVCSRQSCGQYGTHLPHWMQTKGSPDKSRYIASTGQAFAQSPQR